MLAERGSMRIDGTNPDTGKVDPFLFVGRMWVGADLGTDAQRFYPKYPIGFPALVALMLKIGGPAFGAWLAYLINPISMMLAIVAVFFLVRRVAGSFAAFLASAVLALSPVTMALTTNPNSHASTLCFVSWGMFLLVRWWQDSGQLHADKRPLQSALTATLAGFLLGTAATVRYTEGLLVVPLLTVALFNLRPRSLRSWLESALLFAGWAIPVLILACYNVKAMGTLTGYDPTNESSGFRLEFFSVNWYTMLHQLHDTGLAFILPISLTGLLFMFFWNWRFATFMSAWILPSVTIYTFYYWAPDTSTVGYLRFFLTVLPALTLCAFWLVPRLAHLPDGPGSFRPPRRHPLRHCLVLGPPDLRSPLHHHRRSRRSAHLPFAPSRIRMALQPRVSSVAPLGNGARHPHLDDLLRAAHGHLPPPRPPHHLATFRRRRRYRRRRNQRLGHRPQQRNRHQRRRSGPAPAPTPQRQHRPDHRRPRQGQLHLLRRRHLHQ